MIHYPVIIRESGPLRNMWSFKYETKHQEFKKYARSNTSRVNVCVSFAKKYQLKFAYECISNINNPKSHNSESIDAHIHNEFNSGYSEIISGLLGVPVRNLIILSELIFERYKYKKNMYIATFNG